MLYSCIYWDIKKDIVYFKIVSYGKRNGFVSLEESGGASNGGISELIKESAVYQKLVWGEIYKTWARAET